MSIYILNYFKYLNCHYHKFDKILNMLHINKIWRFSYMRENTYTNFINGEFVPSKATKTYDVRNPVTQDLIGKTPQTSQEELNAIIANSAETFKTWSRVPLTSNCFLI